MTPEEKAEKRKESGELGERLYGWCRRDRGCGFAHPWKCERCSVHPRSDDVLPDR